MDHVHRAFQPQLRRPRALLAWEGWNDASDAASGAIPYILRQRDDPVPFAWIEPEEFYDFQVHRPQVEVDVGGTRSLSWPCTTATAIETDAGHDLVLVLGAEPNLRWKTYTRSVARLLAESDVESVVTLGAFIGQVAHTVAVPILGVATDPALVEQYRLQTSNYQGLTGIIAVMLEACREIGIPAVSLWAGVPRYLAANSNPKAMLALLNVAQDVLDIEFDTSELEAATSEFETKIDEAMAENEEFSDYIQRLEENSAEMYSIDPTRGGKLINEIEDFLEEL